VSSDLSSLVLLFSTRAHPSRAARLHSKECAMVNMGARNQSMKACTPTQDDIDDLNERDFPVKRCKCCTGGSPQGSKAT